MMWDVKDREAALVWKLEQGKKCGECGTFEWQWQDYVDGKWVDREKPLEADVWTCRGCEDIDWVRDDLRNAMGSKAGKKIRWFPVNHG